MPLIGATYAAPNKGTTILFWFRSPKTLLNPPVNGKIQGLFKAFEKFSSTFQGKFYFQELFKTVLYIQVLFKPVQTLSRDPVHVSLALCLSYVLAPRNLFVCLFCCFTSQVNSYGHGGTVISPNHTFSWASLTKQLTSTSCTSFRL